jgi:hypothetical protein
MVFPNFGFFNIFKIINSGMIYFVDFKNFESGILIA